MLVDEGADLLDVGGVKAGPGPEVGEAEELDRVVPPIEALHDRFDVAISCDTWRASVLDEACKAGAVVGNDISGFGDPDYLAVAARHGASVVATHIRLQPASPIPSRTTTTSSATSPRSCSSGPRAPKLWASRPSRSCSTPGSTSARRRRRPWCSSARVDALASLGYPLLLSASNKRFLGELLDSRASTPAARVSLGDGRVRRHARVPHRAGARRRRSRPGVPGGRGDPPRVTASTYLVKGTDPTLAIAWLPT